MIGTPLVTELRHRGHSVHTLVRRNPTSPSEHYWNPDTGDIEAGIVESTDVVVNLSGASIGRIPWTPNYKKLILSSRVHATTTLANVIAQATNPPSALIQASAVGFYGDRAENALDEESAAGAGYLAEVCQAWEASASAAHSTKTRVVFARTGLVLGRDGAMAPLRLQTLLGVAGPIGSGRQWWPWISLRDEVAALVFLIENPLAKGPYNLVGPQPARSVDVTKELARQMGRPHWLGLPSIAISLLMGEAGKELLLTSQQINPVALERSGFTFTDQSLESAISQIV
jgi:uncharacterized protein (TIGR01777 family)